VSFYNPFVMNISVICTMSHILTKSYLKSFLLSIIVKNWFHCVTLGNRKLMKDIFFYFEPFLIYYCSNYLKYLNLS